jgi:Protein of unknown function (DUF1242)
MSALFDFASLVTVLLLLICTCTYLRELRPVIFDGGKVRSNEWSMNDDYAFRMLTTMLHPTNVSFARFWSQDNVYSRGRACLRSSGE